MSRIAVLVVFAAVIAIAVAASPKLQTYKVDKTRVAVSGLSAGGYAAVQLHVAYSELFMGAGVWAGGPYHCAKGQIAYALTTCMSNPEFLDVSSLVSYTKSASDIDDPQNLYKDRVYLFSGTSDQIVHQGVMKDLGDYYNAFLADGNVETVFNISAGHSIVTDNYGNDCSTEKSPWINNCHYDSAYYMLDFVYGGISGGGDYVASNLLEFDQSEFLPTSPLEISSMDKTGYIYVPTACQSGGDSECSLMVMMHGCQQGKEYLGDQYALHNGLNQHAEANNIIVLYPQATKYELLAKNPNGCFDWWGYTGKNYDNQKGVQNAAVKKMVDRVMGVKEQMSVRLRGQE